MVDKTSSHGFQDLDKYSSAIAHHTQKTVSRIIKEWYLYTLKRKILLELETYVGSERRRRVKLRVLRDWFELSMRERLNSVREDYLVSRRNRQVLGDLMSYWYRSHYLNRRDGHRAYTRLRRAFAVRLLREVFGVWHMELLNSRKCQRFQRSGGLQRRVFFAWRDEYARMVMIRDEMEARKKRRVFLGLLEYIACRRERREAANLKLRLVEKMRLGRIFNNWVVLVQYSLNKRYTILEWQIGLVNNRMVQILHGWKMVIFKRRQERSRFELVRGRSEALLKLKAFNTWYIMAQESYKEKTMLIISGLSARRQLLMNGFSSFKRYLVHKRESRVLREKSESYLASYVLKVFKRNGGSYAQHKIKLQGAQSLFESKRMRICWERWQQYVDNARLLKLKSRKIGSRYERRMLETGYRVWSYVWFKTVTNRMIVDCMQVKIGMNIKRRVFCFMLYVVEIRRSQFWNIFGLLVGKRLQYSFGRLHDNMLHHKSQEALEDQLGDRIRLSRLTTRWRELVLENRAVSHVQFRTMVVGFLGLMREYAGLKRREEELVEARRFGMEQRVFRIWRLQSRSRSNLQSLFGCNTLEEISRKLTVSCYFRKWYAEYSKRKSLADFILSIEEGTKRRVLVEWKSALVKRLTNMEKYERVSRETGRRTTSKFLRIWLDKYRRKEETREMLLRYKSLRERRTISRAWTKMKQVSRERGRRRRMLNRAFESLRRLIISRAWMRIRENYMVERSLERVSDRYWEHIKSKRVRLIYDHWWFVSSRIRRIRDQERASEEHYREVLGRRFLGEWRRSLGEELVRRRVIYEAIQDRSNLEFVSRLRMVVIIWRGIASSGRVLREKQWRIMQRTKRRSFGAIVDLFNMVNHQKKRILDSMHYEFVNSFVFRLRYSRVVEMSRHVSITLGVSLEMYADYSRLKRAMELWLRSMTERIEQRRVLVRETRVMEARMAYWRLRVSFGRMVRWKTKMSAREGEIRRGVETRLCRVAILELRERAKERRFTIQVSDLLYRNFMMRRLLEGIYCWRERSRYSRVCGEREERLRDTVNKREMSRVLASWRRESREYIRYFRLRRSVEIPIKRRVMTAFKAVCVRSRTLESNKRVVLIAWRALSGKKRVLRERCRDFGDAYIAERLLARVFRGWRRAYQQKQSVYEFYERVVVRRPVEKILASWRFETAGRVQREEGLRRRVEEREKRCGLRSILVAYRVGRMSVAADRRLTERLFRFWRSLHIICRLRRRRVLERCVFGWRSYSERRQALREKSHKLDGARSKRLLEKYYGRLVLEYSKRAGMREKCGYVASRREERERLAVFERWRWRFLQRQRRREIQEKVALVHACCVLRMSLRCWRERLEKKERYRLILYHEKSVREGKLKAGLFGAWRRIWRPCHNLKVAKEMVGVLNRLVLHKAFHRLLVVSFYSYTANEHDLQFGTGLERSQSAIESSYFRECRCSERSIRSIFLVRSGGLVRELLSRVELVRNRAILGMLFRMKDYVEKRRAYENGVRDFESRLRVIMLSRAWVRLAENIRHVWNWRRAVGVICLRREHRTKRRVLVVWVDRYNESFRSRSIVEYMEGRYGNTIKIKCYLIWSIKYEIAKKKRMLAERSERFQRMYILECATRRMNEYYLYSKWVMWCRKAYDTIEWVHEFRIKSFLFISWRRYSGRQKSLKEGLFGLYSRTKRRVLDGGMTRWREVTRSFLAKKELAERYYLERIIHGRRFVGCFFVWKRHTLKLKTQRRRIWGYLENKSRNLKLTCFKLWRFFIYYRKTRNSRFEKITGIIRTNHSHLLTFRVFYSWKLKMIEHKSLKSSIFSFWNSGGVLAEEQEQTGGAGLISLPDQGQLGREGRSPEVHVEDSAARGSEVNNVLSSSRYSLELSVSSLSNMRGETQEKSGIQFMRMFSSSSASSDLSEDSPQLTLTQLSHRRSPNTDQAEAEAIAETYTGSAEMMKLEHNRYPETPASFVSAREFVNRLLSSSTSDLDSSLLAPSTADFPASRPETGSPPPATKSKPSLGMISDLLFSSSPSESSYSDGDLEIEELRSSQALKLGRGQSQSHQSISPNPLRELPPDLNVDSNNIFASNYFSSNQPQIPRPTTSSPFLTLPHSNRQKESIQPIHDLPQDPYSISNSVSSSPPPRQKPSSLNDTSPIRPRHRKLSSSSSPPSSLSPY